MEEPQSQPTEVSVMLAETRAHFGMKPQTFEQRMAKLANRTGTPGGDRREFAALANALVEDARTGVLAEMADPTMQARFLVALETGLKSKDRTAMNIYVKALKVVQNTARIELEFIRRLGARDEEELRRYYSAGKSVEGADAHETANTCTTFLERYCDMFPDQRETVIRRLGGYVPVG